MAESPSALPLLTHLKINVEFPWGETRYDALAGFIRSKKKLRCLDFGEASVYLTMLAPVLSAIESLSGLEVLGLDITVDAFGEAESAYLQRIIPKTVTALRLELGYTQPGMENALKPASPWIELVRHAVLLSNTREERIDLGRFSGQAFQGLPLRISPGTTNNIVRLYQLMSSLMPSRLSN
ncbi:hypothetical protein EVJ58_g9378 [Rhodofomes roseus]|uniref:Uncharacterized protein n=1 Tax=Rhodofomes roseus TaxID=34475 RepID=A0A4Y9XTI5_9APHY|nr:hypothetical protein EVJ58_g9378 [Rhodofomes roseus]